MSYVYGRVLVGDVLYCFADRELTTTKRKMETDVSSQQSVIEESTSRITMLENILAKEAVACQSLVHVSSLSLLLIAGHCYGNLSLCRCLSRFC